MGLRVAEDTKIRVDTFDDTKDLPILYVTLNDTTAHEIKKVYYYIDDSDYRTVYNPSDMFVLSGYFGIDSAISNYINNNNTLSELFTSLNSSSLIMPSTIEANGEELYVIIDCTWKNKTSYRVQPYINILQSCDTGSLSANKCTIDYILLDSDVKYTGFKKAISEQGSMANAFTYLKNNEPSIGYYYNSIITDTSTGIGIGGTTFAIYRITFPKNNTTSSRKYSFVFYGYEGTSRTEQETSSATFSFTQLAESSTETYYWYYYLQQTDNTAINTVDWTNKSGNVIPDWKVYAEYRNSSGTVLKKDTATINSYTWLASINNTTHAAASIITESGVINGQDYWTINKTNYSTGFDVYFTYGDNNQLSITFSINT